MNIVAKEHSNYCWDDKGRVFSWGFNSYCKLGTMNEDTQRTPYCLKPQFIINPKLDNDQQHFKCLGLGGQHVVFITGHKEYTLDQHKLSHLP